MTVEQKMMQDIYIANDICLQNILKKKKLPKSSFVARCQVGGET